MDLSTTYMGLKLRNPLVAAASPLSADLCNLQEMEKAGIAAVVLHSIFEEQITGEIFESFYYPSLENEQFADSLSYFPKPNQFKLTPKEYLEHIHLAKKYLKVPVIASLNVRSADGWTHYTKYLQDAGADALELNVYFLAANPKITGQQIEDMYVEIVRKVKSALHIPVAVKLNPYFSALANMAKRLENAGADALVLFNRFYRPDLNLEKLKLDPNLLLSNPDGKRLPLTWISILRKQLKVSIGATSSIYEAEDVCKMLMVGADATMLCSVLMTKGINHAQTILKDLQGWMKEQNYKTIKDFQASLSQKIYEDQETIERANYIRMLQSYKQ